MVEISSDNSLSVTGILNWDRACFAPRYVSCAPPWWLWQDESYGDIDSIEDESKADDESPDTELQEVKQVFEDTVGDEFCRYAYHTQYPIARELFNIALHGNHSNEQSHQIESCLAEWAAFYKTEVEDYVSESDEGSAHLGTEEEAKGSQEDSQAGEGSEAQGGNVVTEST